MTWSAHLRLAELDAGSCCDGDCSCDLLAAAGTDPDAARVLSALSAVRSELGAVVRDPMPDDVRTGILDAVAALRAEGAEPYPAPADVLRHSGRTPAALRAPSTHPVVPGSAQPAVYEPAGSDPTTLQPAVSSPAAPQPAASTPATPQPAASTPATPQPAASTPATPQPDGSQPVVAQPAASQLAVSQPGVPEPTASQPTASQPTESQPTESQPTESQPTESQPTESQPAAGPGPAVPNPTPAGPTARNPAAAQPAGPQPAAPAPAGLPLVVSQPVVSPAGVPGPVASDSAAPRPGLSDPAPTRPAVSDPAAPPPALSPPAASQPVEGPSGRPVRATTRPGTVRDRGGPAPSAPGNTPPADGRPDTPVPHRDPRPGPGSTITTGAAAPRMPGSTRAARFLGGRGRRRREAPDRPGGRPSHRVRVGTGVAAVVLAVVGGVLWWSPSGTPRDPDTLRAAAAPSAVPEGPLSDPARQAACLAAVGVATPPVRAPSASTASTPPAPALATRRVLVDGAPGVLLVLPTGDLGRFRLLVVDPECGSGGGHVLADQVVAR
ncbi:hypothetical protein Psed_6677 [Pseudonocardia dioxanivorans CB1190]|uniref:Uncharacterized protein n=1 Tax=Pseudonocardia dioxanivorans (strain ATCC 55486 / DSM 44775 / JCM 13855 / CB1190) TaxID=675635 RepID=F4CXV9_PSEUX|nr:hypothetical protein Psed_6677 [Pseudonocardia dioxanivorans CB1190]